MNPIQRFSEWYAAAQKLGHPEPTHVVLATADRDAKPSARVVLLKEHNEQGFVFFTNFTSRKGRELAENPQAALLFYWPLRQVRVEGPVSKTSSAESDSYWGTRARESQLGAWASLQSAVLADRAALQTRLAELESEFPHEVPRPPHWGGYRLQAAEIEFWEAGDHRLHQRERYRRAGETWTLQLLHP